VFFNPESCRNETEVESKFVAQYLLPALGYGPETWNQEVSFGNIRLDFLAFAAQRIGINLPEKFPSSLIVEAKGPKQNLIPHVPKLKRYLTRLGIPYGLLTNGKDFRIYGHKEQDVDLIFQCRGTEVESNLEVIRSIIGYMQICQTRLSRQHSTEVYRSKENSIQSKGGDAEDLANGTSDLVMNEPIEKPFEETQFISEPDPFVNTNLMQSQPRSGRMKTIAVYHNKGGVGKTTTVVNLAAALSKLGKRVLVIDLDSQANTTFAVGLVKFDDEANDNLKDSNVLHLLSSEDLYPIRELARTTSFCSEPVDVVPSHICLMEAESDLNRIDLSRGILVDKLREVEDDYDFVIIDTPPALNLYARIALIAANYLIVPSDLKPFANQGLKNVKGLIKDVNGFRKMLNIKPIDLLGVLPTKVNTNSKFIKATLPKRIQTIIDRYDYEVMESVIYERDDVAKSSEQTEIFDGLEIPGPRSILDFKPESQAAQEFRDLAQEVLRKTEINEVAN